MTMKHLFLLSFVFFFAQANIGPQGFKDFPNYYFVETGCYIGQGIGFALRAQFTEIHSLELLPKWVHFCRNKFRNNKKVQIYQGNSGQMLYEVIKNFDKEITFWLDGHRGTPAPNGGKNTPLLEELEQIKKHHIKTHTILIDDMHCCGTILFDGLTKEDIIAKILEVNPNYEITYIPGGDKGEYPQNVMVAQVK